MEHLTVPAWCILVVAAFLLGVAKSGIPGLGVLAIPLVALVLPARASTGLILPMLILGDVFAVAYYRRHVQWQYLWRLFPWALAGILAGYDVLNLIPDRAMRPLIGAIVLAMLVVHAWRRWRGDIEVPHHWSFTGSMGLLGGFATMVANAAGPVMQLYLLAMRLPKWAFLGTGAWYFLIVNWVKVPFMVSLEMITPASLRVNLLLAPALIAGAMGGVFCVRLIPERSFTRIVEILTAITALALIFS